METLDYIYSDKMVFLAEEHLLKAIQQKHPSSGFQKLLFKSHSPKLTSLIQLLHTYLFIVSCMYKKLRWVQCSLQAPISLKICICINKYLFIFFLY